ITYTYTVKDACNNALTGRTYTTTGGDVTPPTVNCPGPATYTSVNGSIPPVTGTSNTGNATATDNCGGTPTVTFTDVSTCSTNNTSTQYTIVRTFRATDACGNSSTCSQTITVNRSVTDGCFTAELTGRVVSGGNTTFTYNACGNNCKDLSHISFVTDKNYRVISPANGSFYKLGTNDYKVVTPVSSTQYGIKFEAISKTAMLQRKGCYTFVFTLAGNVPASAITVVFKAGTGTANNATAPCPGTNQATITSATGVGDQIIAPPAKLTVSTFPNPYTDKVKFVIQSPVSGQASLEVFNMLGQKVQSVYKGHVQAGVGQSVEYNVPYANRGNLIYILRVGNQKAIGKLIHPN
ncbi:MAG: T9SS type A sorting domain-containing protein, partial [Segetibacter sp.]|nr:T9SS type A sorting domain-containing protein [Segetibacter sp.]